MLRWLLVSPCHTVNEFIYRIVLPWVWPPHEHAAVDNVVDNTVQETRLSRSLEMDKWRFLDHDYFVFCLLAPLRCLLLPLILLSLVPNSRYASPVGGTALLWRGTSASGSSWATKASFHHAWCFAVNFYFMIQWKSMVREKLQKYSKEQGSDAMTRGHVVGTKMCLEPEMCLIFFGNVIMSNFLSSQKFIYNSDF